MPDPVSTGIGILLGLGAVAASGSGGGRDEEEDSRDYDPPRSSDPCEGCTFTDCDLCNAKSGRKNFER